MKIVTNTSPLIGFAILGQLELLPLIFDEIYIPQGVFEEASAWGKPYSKQLKIFATDRIKIVQNKIAVQLLSKDVDKGEAEVIALALEDEINNVLIDDVKGRKIAKLHGLHPIGTIGIIASKKNRSY